MKHISKEALCISEKMRFSNHSLTSAFFGLDFRCTIHRKLNEGNRVWTTSDQRQRIRFERFTLIRTNSAKSKKAEAQIIGGSTPTLSPSFSVLSSPAFVIFLRRPSSQQKDLDVLTSSAFRELGRLFAATISLDEFLMHLMHILNPLASE
jgi:hypothetical protein